MKQIDVFKLADKLGFDVRGAELKNSINSIMLVDENTDNIICFNTNKVIAYNCKMPIEIKINTVAKNLYCYIKNKTNENELIMCEVNRGIEPLIDINLLTELCIEKRLLNKKKDVKKLYKKMY